MYNKRLTALPLFLFKMYNKSLIKYVPNYQPLMMNGSIVGGGDRTCKDRWSLIKKEIEKYGVETVCDIGSAEGYYVLRAANEMKCFSLGIEADIRRLALAQNQLLSEEIKGAGFIHGVVDEDFLDQMPSFDMIIFMSVMHHIMYSKGEEYSRLFLQHLRKKVNDVMIFEMGQSNEIKNEWAPRLPDMGAEPHVWIKNFLQSAGFSRVEQIGLSDSYKKEQSRAIFKVHP